MTTYCFDSSSNGICGVQSKSCETSASAVTQVEGARELAEKTAAPPQDPA